jgi:hypothetical protein
MGAPFKLFGGLCLSTLGLLLPFHGGSYDWYFYSHRTNVDPFPIREGQFDLGLADRGFRRHPHGVMKESPSATAI